MKTSAQAALVLAALALLAGPVTAQGSVGRDDDSAETGGCALVRGGATGQDARACAGCHQMADHGHPVEADYAQARYRQGSSQDLRPLEEITKRGVRLVAGRVTCVTCHDASSRFGSHLAIPPGALVRPAANLTQPATYERPEPLQPARLVRQGTQVSPKPLCLSCHAFD